MIKQSSTFLLVFLTLSSLTRADDPCRYEVSGKGVIDITSLSGTGGKAAFPDQTPTTGQNYVYSYNPCKPFTEDDPCTDVAACQVSKDGAFRFVLAKQDSVKWSLEDTPGANPMLTYTFETKKVTVEIQCSDSTNPLFTAIGEVQTNNYEFRLSHKCGCWDGCKGSKPSGGGGDGGGIGGGAIFIIILVVIVFVYLIVFTVINATIHHRRGAELIPHREFWVASPGYVKDGFLFIFRRATGKGSYQSV